MAYKKTTGKLSTINPGSGLPTSATRGSSSSMHSIPGCKSFVDGEYPQTGADIVSKSNQSVAALNKSRQTGWPKL